MEATKPSINKDRLYGTYTASVERDQKLKGEMARKALDLPMEDEVISANKTTTYNGLGGKAVAAIVAATLLGAGGLGLGVASLPALLSPAPPQREAPPVEAQPPGPAKTREFRVEFFDKDGNPIAIQEK